MTEPVLSAEGVSYSYGRERVLDGVTFELRQGEFVALVGPNGSGKSTLLRCLLGLLRPEAGTVRLFGEDPRSLRDRWRLGYVPQRPFLDRDLPASVEEVVAAGRLSRTGWWRRLRADDRTAVTHAMESVGLLGLRGPAGPRALRAASSSGCSSRRRSPANRSCWSSTSRSPASTPSRSGCSATR